MEMVKLTGAPTTGFRAFDESEIPTIPFRMAVLPNGLTLIVHEDRRNPLVSTQLRFNVGSKDEPAGRTGFAHLFEHLMFRASANRRGNWHNTLHEMGGVGVNGTTSPDRTNYYQTVPTAALDQLLWMESDRMGHLLGAIDAETLADEVSVIKNEKREREGAPYGGVFEAITTTLYPRDHPYGHTVLGSFEDLDNADLDTVADWYARWYGAANAILVIAGDIDFDEALAKVEYWFGAMPAGIPVRRATQWLPDTRALRKITLFDRVPNRQLYAIWSMPNAADSESALLQVIAAILASAPHSRLVQRLVDGDRLCLGVRAISDARYLCGEFQIVATLAPGADAAAVEHAIAEELHRFVIDGPSQDELDRVRRAARLNMLRMRDNLGAIAEVLASSMMTFGQPDGHLAHVERTERATTEDIRIVAARWLSHQSLALDVRPFEAVVATVDPAERTFAPVTGPIQAPIFPTIEQATLANGLAVRVARRPGVLGASFVLMFDNGARLDPAGAEGLSRVALAALDRGTRCRTKQIWSETFGETGFKYQTSVLPDFATLSIGALRHQSREALHMLAELLLEPVFPADEIRLLLDRCIAGARGQGTSPADAAGMAIDRLLYGRRHYYGRPAGGNPESLATLMRDMIVARHRAWLDPARATLIVVGDLALDQVTELAESAFAGWQAGATMAFAPSEALWTPSPGRYLIERPGGAQTALWAGMATPEIRPDNEALTIFNTLFGGSFGSRLNTNLRERRGWTYGVRSGFSFGAALGSFLIHTEVQADRTLDALAEIEGELRALGRGGTVTRDEIEEARHGLLVGLPGRWVGNGAVVDGIIEQTLFGLPEDHHNGVEARIRGASADDIEAVVGLLRDPGRYSWVVAGDPACTHGADFVRIDAEANRL